MDTSTVIEGTVKFRDGKKWKSRWCVMRKLSPVADCLHLQLYRDSKERYKQGHTKASLSLQHFLAIESGFTLDKESNTIAIICQDVTVILAFDTRERLIQWQVKISNNLGEGVQYLIQITSAPPKAKIASGPARLHVQDQRFCMTSGVPPRLLGFWEIGQLRRYGVVEGRFVFEGGSRCGKGEGVHVCVTDQGDEITKTFELAAQGKVASRRRPVARNMSMIDSPRRQTLSRGSDVSCGLQSVMSQHQHLPGEPCVEGAVCSCRQHRDGSSPYWLSIESSAAHSSDLDSNYGCGDTASVSEHFALHDLSGAGLERCVSCISKLGAASMSRSSTATPMTPSSAWAVPLVATPDCGHGYRSNAGSSVSSHGSDGGAWYDRPPPPPQVPPKSPRASPSRAAEAAKCHCCPPSRPPKPPQILHKVPETESPTTKKLRKPPLPLPLLRHSPSCQQVACKCPEQRHTLVSTLVKTPEGTLHICPYDNYDVPKPILGNTYMKDAREDLSKVPDVSDGYYDTPKSIRECLSSTPCYPLTYGNYDVPLSARHLQTTCNCVLKYPKTPGSIASPVDKVIIDKHESTPKSAPNSCPCQRVMCWAENWMMLPYCKRGSGIENTGVPIPKVKLSGEGKMPVMNANGDIAIYNTVDCTKHASSRNPSVCKQLTYDNVPVDRECSESTRVGQSDEAISCGNTETNKSNIRNYANMSFSESLEYYENSKDVITRAGISVPSMSELMNETLCKTEAGDGDHHEVVNVCNKCGHACRVPSDGKITLRKADATENLVTTAQEDYLFMEPRSTPVTQSCAAPSLNAIGDVSRTLHSYIASSDKCAAITGRSVSIPSLDTSLINQSLADHLRSHAMVRCKSENNKYSSRSSRPSADELRKQHFLLRKRSSSADSSRFLDEVDEVDNSLEEPCGLPQAGSCDSVLHSTTTLTENTDLCVKEVTSTDLQETALNEAQCTKVLDVAQADLRSSEDAAATDREDDTAVEDESSTNESLSVPVPKSEPVLPGVVACMRRSSSVPSKSANNRDSSSSNDSGVSVGSLKHRGGDFAEFELPLTTSLSSKRHHHVIQRHTAGCLHSSLPRRSKSVDPLRDISFQFKEIESQVKCSSAEAEVPVCLKRRGFQSPSGDSAIVVPYPDSRSTSSGTSDMSDYIETLSLSSHSSSDVQESLRLGKLAVTTLKPRSGNEYQLIDRSVLEGGGKV